MIDFATAQQNAEQEIQRIQQTSAFWGTYQLEPLRLAKETDVTWVFFRGSRELLEQAHAPGGLFVTVDKQTGRIWTQEEIEAYYTQLAAVAPQKIAA